MLGAYTYWVAWQASTHSFVTNLAPIYHCHRSCRILFRNSLLDKEKYTRSPPLCRTLGYCIDPCRLSLNKIPWNCSGRRRLCYWILIFDLCYHQDTWVNAVVKFVAHCDPDRAVDQAVTLIAGWRLYSIHVLSIELRREALARGPILDIQIVSACRIGSVALIGADPVRIGNVECTSLSIDIVSFSAETNTFAIKVTCHSRARSRIAVLGRRGRLWTCKLASAMVSPKCILSESGIYRRVVVGVLKQR